MNWKFWQRPAPAAAAVVDLTDKEWTERVLPELRRQLAHVTPADDPLLAGFLGLIDANVRVELPPAVMAGLTSEERHRFAGRLGMLLDLKSDLLKLHREAVQQRQEQKS